MGVARESPSAGWSQPAPGLSTAEKATVGTEWQPFLAWAPKSMSGPGM
jgi:hypothetical protein